MFHLAFLDALSVGLNQVKQLVQSIQDSVLCLQHALIIRRPLASNLLLLLLASLWKQTVVLVSYTYTPRSCMPDPATVHIMGFSLHLSLLTVGGPHC
jgi:hypothetical protein